MTRLGKAASLAAAITALAALAAPACAQDSPALRQGVVAIVNDNAISSYDLQQRVRLIVATSGIQPTAQNAPQLEQEALNELIDERIEMQEVRRAEKDQKFTIVATDDEVNDRIDEIAQQNYHMSGKQFLVTLANAGIGQATFVEQIRASMSWERWMGGRYGGSRLKISQAQINTVISEQEAAASEPQYLIGEIFVDAGQAGGLPAAETGAEQLITQLQQGAPFTSVARQFSSASSAAAGGDAGWLTEHQLPPEVRPVVEQLRPGELSSKPIAAENGYYIILLRDKRAGATSELVQLKQAAISLPTDATPEAVAAAQQKLLALKAQLTGCTAMEAKAAKFDGVVAGDLGEADVKDLKPAFREAVQSLSVGQISDPIRTDAGLHLLALCGRRQAGVEMPSRDEIEEHLKDDEISLISKRQLRDLRNSATIEFP